MVERAYNACMNSEQLPINVTAWMKSIAQPEAGLFLEALPKTPETTLTDPEFESVFNYRYLLTQSIIPNGTRCICTNRPSLDLLGHHAMTGCKCGGGRQNTHDMIKHMVTRMCRYACVKSIEEEIGIFRATDPGTSKRPDVTVERGPLHPLHIIIDVTVTCPLPGAAGTGAPGLSRAQAGVQGRAAEKASQGKITKYGALAAGNQLLFIPLVFESTGYVHPDACEFFAKVAEYASKVKLIPKAAIYKFWMTQFSVTLQKALAHALCRKVMVAMSKEGGVHMGQAEVDVLDMQEMHITPN
jgi:hypothetical protein